MNYALALVNLLFYQFHRRVCHQLSLYYNSSLSIHFSIQDILYFRYHLHKSKKLTLLLMSVPNRHAHFLFNTPIPISIPLTSSHFLDLVM
ncbi:uncharacterized protein DS421_15g516080 [Arachis hypogaea]|nr:uncharacterized protein DS421_15g516080 [Arachis hypogaea]